MRNLIDGDFLYIDCDTVICAPLKDIEKCSGELLLVPDGHENNDVNRRGYFSLKTRADFITYHTGYNHLYFNGGVMYSRDTKKCHEFFNLWHKGWQETCKKGIAQDQLSLNEANYKMGGFISELDGVYNCQNTTGLKWLPKAKVIHYFSSTLSEKSDRPFYILGNWPLLKEIKDSGKVTDTVQNIIDNPKNPECFCGGKYVLYGSDTFDIITNGAIDFLRVLKNKLPFLYNALNKMMLKRRSKQILKKLKNQSHSITCATAQ